MLICLYIFCETTGSLASSGLAQRVFDSTKILVKFGKIETALFILISTQVHFKFDIRIAKFI